ncbi:MAG: M14 family zinc carboxypeptidase [Candidatus Bathyarchaeia archaeon]
MQNFSEVLDAIPDYKAYLTVDELKANDEALSKKYSKTVKILELGRSVGGIPITCLKIGEGKHNALIYGFPNSEEPVGGVALDYFARVLADRNTFLHDTDYTWYLIKCIDPDGAKLNSGFQKGPLTPINFAENYYRAHHFLAGERAFPFRYGALDFNNPTAETKALMKIMDSTRFDLISSLHNMKWGGITYQVSEACPQLYPPLQSLTQKYRVVPRKRGQIEEIPGAAVSEYASLVNPQVFTIVPECCLWYDERCWDDEPSKTNMTDVLKYASSVSSEANKFLLYLYEKAEPHLTISSPFGEMIQQIAKGIRNPTIKVSDPDPDLGKQNIHRPATVGEQVETEGRADLYRMFNLGGIIRMIDYELTHGNGDKTRLKELKTEARQKLEEWNNQVHQKYHCTANPIRNLIGVSLGAILFSSEYVKWKRWNV